MNRMALRQLFPGNQVFGGLASALTQILFALFMVEYVLAWIGLWLPGSTPGTSDGSGLVLFGLATATTLAALSRRLPVQNVAAVLSLILTTAGVSLLVQTGSGLPGRAVVNPQEAGSSLVGVLPLTVAAFWVLAILTSRATARLILLPWRGNAAYGLWMLALTAVLAVVFDLGLEPFATQVKHYWWWRDGASGWYSAPWVSLVGWALTCLVILVFATPFLISKKPVEPPLDYQGPAVWVLLNLWFAGGAATRQLWTAAVLGFGLTLTFAILCIVGGWTQACSKRQEDLE